MPTYKIEKKYAAALAAGVVKANTKKEIVKKTGSVILLAKDIVDGLNANSIKRYYEGTELSILSGISNVRSYLI